MSRNVHFFILKAYTVMEILVTNIHYLESIKSGYKVIQFPSVAISGGVSSLWSSGSLCIGCSVFTRKIAGSNDCTPRQGSFFAAAISV